MPISFANIPANIKVPLYWVEVDPSKAGLPQINLRALLVGVMTADGTATADIPVPVGSQAMADQFFGQGSELSRMFKAFFANNFANEVWGLPCAEPVAAAAATGTITVTTPPTAAGTLHLYVAGEHIPVNINTTDTVDDIASAIESAVNDMLDLPVTAAATTGTVTLTCVWKGISGNDINVMLNYYGTMGGEQTPTGLDITLPVSGFMTGGTGTPVFDNGILNMGETPFEYICVGGYTDSNTLFAWNEELGFEDSGRWGWQRQLYGHSFFAKRGDYSSLVLWADASLINSGLESVMAFEANSPTPSFEWAAAYTAKAQRALVNDPARPLQALTLNKVKAAPFHDRFDFVELNSLASNGLAIQEVGADGQPMIAREQTTYMTNLYGAPDDAYELVTTLATLAKLLRNQKQVVTSQFPRSKLADDGTRFGPGQAIVTPSMVKAALITQYQIDMYNGLCENLQAFTDYLIVERNVNDPNRLDVLYPPDLINQLRIFAVLAQFRLQYDRGIDLQLVGGAPGSSPPFNAASGL